MKRAIYMLTAMLLLSSVSVNAQLKLDEAGMLKKLEKLETDSKDAKKATRPATWTDLGQAYLSAADIYSSSLFTGLDQNIVQTNYGAPDQTSTVAIGGTSYQKLSYPNLDIYLRNGKVAFWLARKELVANALQKGADAYAKAYAVDNSAKTMAVATQGMNKAADLYKQDGANYYAAEQYEKAANSFYSAFNILATDPVNMYDTATLFNAGFLYAAAGDNARAVKYLSEVLEKGYESEGQTYFYLIHAYIGEGNLDAAKEVAKRGLSKYPTNLALVDIATNVFVETGEDPTSILPYIRQAIAADPNNPELHAALGRVMDKMGNIDGAIEEFMIALNKDPENFAFNYNTALMIMKKADSDAIALRDNPVTSQANFNEKLALLNSQYEKALVPLEKAHQINPQEKNTVELLKNLYFRLRDLKPEYLENYNKYDQMLKNM